MGLRPYWDPISSSDASMFLITECKSNKIGSKIVTISLCTVLGSLLLTSFNLLLHMDEEEDNYRGESDGGDKELELPLIDFSTLMDATHNLSTENLLEKGGFGPVYKVTFKDPDSATRACQAPNTLIRDWVIPALAQL